MVSQHPRKQRKMRYEAPKHRRQKMMKSHLSRALYEKYGMRNLVVRKGDIVRVMRGKFKGHEGKVVEVNLKNMKIAVEGVTNRRTDNKSVQFWIDASNVEIVKLELGDKKRKEKIYAMAEERRGTIVEEEEYEEELEEEESEEEEENSEEAEPDGEQEDDEENNSDEENNEDEEVNEDE